MEPHLRLWVGAAYVRTAGVMQMSFWAKRTVVLTPMTLEWYFDTDRTQVAGSVPLQGSTLVSAKDALIHVAGVHLLCVDIDWAGQDFLPLRFSVSDAHDAMLVSKIWRKMDRDGYFHAPDFIFTHPYAMVFLSSTR